MGSHIFGLEHVRLIIIEQAFQGGFKVKFPFHTPQGVLPQAQAQSTVGGEADDGALEGVFVTRGQEQAGFIGWDGAANTGYVDAAEGPAHGSFRSCAMIGRIEFGRANAVGSEGVPVRFQGTCQHALKGKELLETTPAGCTHLGAQLWTSHKTS